MASRATIPEYLSLDDRKLKRVTSPSAFWLQLQGFQGCLLGTNILALEP